MADDKGSPDNAKKAMADYYDDMLGTLSGSAVLPNSAAEEHSLRPSDWQESDSAKPLSRENTRARRASDMSSGARDPQVKPAIAPKSASSFAEPVTKERKLPTLAPPKVKPARVEAKVVPKVDVAVKPETVCIDIAQTEIDALPKTQNVLATTETVAQADQTTAEPQQLKPNDWLENGRPEWAQSRFECLLFSVAGLKLAVPLVSLGSIHRIENEFTPLVGRADWFIGLYRAGERNINVVDTAKWVMPRQYHDRVVEGYHFVIRLGDTNWGVACDSVAEAVQLEPGQVKWRTERSKRAWLSGTVIDHMCALLDADMLGYLLQQDARPDGKKGSGI